MYQVLVLGTVFITQWSSVSLNSPFFGLKCEDGDSKNGPYKNWPWVSDLEIFIPAGLRNKWVAVAANRKELLVCLSIRLASYYPRWGVCGGCSCVGVIFVRETCEWNLSCDLALVLIVFVFWEYPTLTDDGTHYGRWSPTLLSSIWTHRNTWLMSHQINFLSSLNLSISHFPPWK